MQYVNEDMDDLFRRAAEEYPLKTDGADWDKLMNKMQGDENKTIPEKKGNKARYLLLLILIPLAVICTTYIRNTGPYKTGAINKEKTGDQSVTRNSFETKTETRREDGRLSGNEIMLKPGEKGSEEEGPIPGNSVTINGNVDQVANNTIAIEKSDRKKLISKKEISGVESKPDKAVNDQLVEQINETKNKDVAVKDQTEKPNGPVRSNPVATDQKSDNSVTSSDQTVADTKADNSAVKNDAAKTSSVAADKKEKIKRKESKFYFGLQAGPDFTMVKSTNIRGVGFSFGLLAGYNFNKKFSVETGIIWDRKKYQSEGKHFNTEKLNWPHVTVLDVSGYCNMYEIPLNFRYNFSANAQRTFFANAGLSSYLMKKENYDYDYSRYGVYQRGQKEYKNTTNDWFSVVHVSMGMQTRLGSIGDLRIEPYAKLPVNGVGLGSLPLRSTGVYLGITRPIR